MLLHYVDSAAAFLFPGVPVAGEASSSSPAMSRAHSQLAEGQQNSRRCAQTVPTFSRSPCSFRWSLQGLLRKALLPAPGTPANTKAAMTTQCSSMRALKRWKQLKAMEKMDALLDMRGSWAGLLKQLQLR